MASTMTTLQTHDGFPYYERSMSQPNSNLFGPQQGWASALCGGRAVTPAYLNYAASNTPPSENELHLHPRHTQEPLTTHLGKRSHAMSIQVPHMYSTIATTTSLSPPVYADAGPDMYPQASLFNAANVTANQHHSPTLSPHETRFDLHRAPAPFSSPYSFQSPPQPLQGQNTVPFSHASRHAAEGMHGSSPENRYHSASPARVPSVGGRRRRSENVEPGSTRAIYLEKNRKAASKCRSKQKMQQEGLVQTAHDFKVRNDYLKNQVKKLKKEMSDLMEEVSPHNDCEDGRLREYIQRKADRLASGIQPAPYIPPMLVRTDSISPSTPSSIQL